MRLLKCLLIPLFLASPAAAQPDDTVQHLVQRLTGQGQVLVGAMPADLQTLLPLPEGVRILATLNPAGLSAGPDQVRGIERPPRLLLAGPLAAFRVTDAQLRGAGWLPFPRLDPDNPFQASADLNNGSYYHPGRHLVLTLHGLPGLQSREEGPLTYVDMEVRRDAHLAEQYASVMRARAASPLPALTAPAGLMVTPDQQTRTAFGAVYSVAVRGSASVEALHEHYAALLRQAGWSVNHTQLDGSGNRSSVWLTSAAKGPARTATLMVAAIPERPGTFVVALGYFGPV